MQEIAITDVTTSETVPLRGINFFPQLLNLISTLETLDPNLANPNMIRNWADSKRQEWFSMKSSNNGVINMSGEEIVLLSKVLDVHTQRAELSPSQIQSSKLVVIEGATGVGKSTLVEKLGMPVVREHVEDNSWLPFSAIEATAQIAAFPAQLHFMLGRFLDITDFYKEQGSGNFIADRFLEGDRAYIEAHFAAGNLSEQEYKLLDRTRDLLSPLIPNQQTIMLYCDPTFLARRVVARGRSYEVNNMEEVLASQSRTINQLGISDTQIAEFIVKGNPVGVLTVNNDRQIHIINTTQMSSALVVDEVKKII